MPSPWWPTIATRAAKVELAIRFTQIAWGQLSPGTRKLPMTSAGKLKCNPSLGGEEIPPTLGSFFSRDGIDSALFDGH
jgi:hypothetical protein